MFWTLALRNVLRNKRRTAATVLAIGLSCAALLLFGGYVVWGHLAGETHAITISGHGQLFKEGYRTKGAGNPAAYAIENFDAVRAMILADEVIGPLVDVVTGQLVVQGMLSYAERQSSTPFIGLGVFPDDLEHITRWNRHGVADVRDIAANAALFASGPELSEAEPDGITLGVGLAGILDLENPAGKPPAERPTVEMLSQPPSGGLVNMVSATVRKLSARQWEELDYRLVLMPVRLASDLLFPGEPVRVTSITVLLNDTNDLPVVEARLRGMIADGRLPLEWRNYREMNTNLVRSVELLDMFFLFAFCIIAVILVFTIYNTMMMSVMERVHEIGTMRAMGVSRPDIVKMFSLEGLVLGIAGGSLGVVLALVIAWIINSLEILYTPPFVIVHAKVEVFILQAPWLIIGSFSSCLLVALVGAFFPASRASRMEIVDALRR